MSLLTSREVAALLHVHPKHVYRLLRKGLPARRVGGEWRFDREDVLAWSRPAGARPAQLAAPVPLPGVPPLVAANGDRAVLLLLGLLRDEGHVFGLVQADQGAALKLLGDRKILVAGCHAGGFPGQLGGDRLARIHLVTREVGIASRRPLQLRELRRARLASRPPSAGVRRYLDEACGPLRRRPLICASHIEVVSAIARGEVDAGICSRAWADALGLVFRPLAREPYGLLVRARDLGDARVVRICETAQGARFRAAASIPGYDAAAAGDIRYDGSRDQPRAG